MVLDKTYLDSKFREDRVFHSLAINMNAKHVENFLTERLSIAYPKSRVRKARWIVDAEQHKKSGVFLSVLDAPIDALRDFPTSPKNNNLFRYYIHVLFLKREEDDPHNINFFISAPFTRILKDHIVDVLRNEDNTRGLKIKYMKTRVKELVEASAKVSDKESDDSFKSTRVNELNIHKYGDHRFREIVFRGKDVPKSDIYRKITSSGLITDPVSHYNGCKLVYKNRFTLELDQYGRFAFRISANGKNFRLFQETFQFLSDNNFLYFDTEPPIIQTSLEHWNSNNGKHEDSNNQK